jgi:hypothetical protein
MNGKAFLGLMFFTVLIVSSLHAQRFYGGVMGGFNGSQVEGDMAYGYHKLGGVLGAWVATDLGEQMYWSMEVKYSEKGSRIIPSKKNDYWKYIYRLNYAELPLLLGYRYDENVSLFAGFSFNYLIYRYGEDSWGVDPSFFDLKLNKVDYEFLMGIRANFDLLVNKDWARRTELDFRWQHSIVPFYYFGKAARYIDTGQFNNLFSTTLLYRIEWGI